MQSVGEHLRCYEGTVINNRFRVINECGTGNFARVFKCLDMQTNAHVALKFLKREYARDAAFEVDVLKALTRLDPSGKEKVLTLIDFFTYNRYPCFVFPLRGCTLKGRRFGVNTPGGFTAEEFNTLAADIFSGINFLHNTVRAVHTDLKPENVLLEAGCTGSSPSRAFYLADFGSASFYQGKLEHDLISTRPYRGPEVLIGLGWSFAADIWSLGCILFEVFTGQSFIPHSVHTDHEQLVCIQQRLEMDIPPAMVARCKQRKLFDFNNRLMPCPFRREKLRPLREVLRGHDALADLLTKMLHPDPTQRIRSEVILEHPFVRQCSPVCPVSRSTSECQATVAAPTQIKKVPPPPPPARSSSSSAATRQPPATTGVNYPLPSPRDHMAVPNSARGTDLLSHHYHMPSSARTAAALEAYANRHHQSHRGLLPAPTTPISSNAAAAGYRVPRHEYGIYGLSR